MLTTIFNMLITGFAGLAIFFGVLYILDHWEDL